MRVAFVSSHPIQYQSHWFRALSAHSSLDVEVLYGWKPDAKAQGGSGFGVPFEWDVPLLDGYSHRFLRNVSRRPSTDTFWGIDTPDIGDLIRSRAFDAVVTNGWHYKSAWQAIRACWASSVPVLVRSDSHLHTERPALTRYAKKLPYRWFIPRLDGCLPVGRWSAEYFMHYGARPERVHVVRYSASDVFAERADRIRQMRCGQREEWTIGAGQVVFLYAGKFTTEKRPMDFIEAIVSAAADEPRIVGLMVGDGPLRQACESQVASIGAAVRFTGFLNQSEIVKAFVAADALVLCSEAETWGLVVNEAMSCGTPALVSDRVGCSPELVRRGVTGEVFPRGDVRALASHMVTYSRSPERLAEMGKQARLHMRAFSTSASVDAMVQALTKSIT